MTSRAKEYLMAAAVGCLIAIIAAFAILAHEIHELREWLSLTYTIIYEHELKPHPDSGEATFHIGERADDPHRTRHLP